MKPTIKKLLYTVLLIGTSSLISCGRATPDAHEQLFLDTAEALNNYSSVSTVQKQLANPLVRDYARLNYADFKQKYNLGDAEMDNLAKSFQTTVEIAKAYQRIEMNQRQFEEIDTTESTVYVNETTP